MNEVDEWFMREVLPLESALSRVLRRNGYAESEQSDIRQELYVQVYESARGALPDNTKAFVFRALRNLLINQVRRSQVVSIESVADIDSLNLLAHTFTPERDATAKEELRRLREGLDLLPKRCREVVVLRRVQGLSQRQAAEKMGVKVSTIEKQMAYGLRALTDFMLGGAGKIKRDPIQIGSDEDAL